MLAQARSWLVWTGLQNDTLPAWIAVKRTQELAPESLEATLATAYYRYWARRDYTGALAGLVAADRLLPNSAELLATIGNLQRRLGRWDEAVTVLHRAVQVDPRSTRSLLQLAWTYFYLRRGEDAEHVLDRVLLLDPQRAEALMLKVDVLMYTFGDTARAHLRAACRTSAFAVQGRRRQW